LYSLIFFNFELLGLSRTEFVSKRLASVRGFGTVAFTGRASALWQMRPPFRAPLSTPSTAVAWLTAVTIHRSAASEVSGSSVALDVYSSFSSGFDQNLQHFLAGL